MCDLVQDIEIEIKFPLKNPEQLVRELDSKAKHEGKDIFQKDSYYVPAHRDFFDKTYPYEWLRIRESTKGAFLNYKHFHPENVEKTDYCDELETMVENPRILRKIFASLDFKEAVVVEKTRNTWNFKGVEIAVDNVNGLGFYIELEAKKEFNDVREAKQYLFGILSELNASVGEEELRGYPYIVLKKDTRS